MNALVPPAPRSVSDVFSMHFITFKYSVKVTNEMCTYTSHGDRLEIDVAYFSHF